MSDQETITLCTITPNDQVQFADGAKRGYLFYHKCCQGKKQSPRALYDFLINILINTTHTTASNAAYIAGRFSPLHQNDNPHTLSPLPHHPSPPLRHFPAPPNV